MKCEYCGTRLFEIDRNCPSCGGNISEIRNNVELHDRVIYNSRYSAEKEWYDEAIAIAVAGGDLSIRLGQKKQLKVYGLTPSASPFLLSNNFLKFVPEKNNILYVSPSDGTIYGNKKGVTGLRVICRERPDLESIIIVEVV